MDLRGDHLAEYLTFAQAVALKTRESQMLDLRYGLSGEEPHTLTEIGLAYNLSRERVRQILAKALRKIRGRGKRYIKQGQTCDPCAQLLLYLQGIIRPDELGHMDRLVAFIENDLCYLPTQTHALPLVTSLMYESTNKAQSYQKEVGRRIRELHQSRRREYKQRCRLEHLLSYVIWPSQVHALTCDQVAEVKRQRNVSTDSDGHASSFMSQKMNREVQYESMIEFTFLLRLEELPEVVLYQEQPFVVPYQQGERTRCYYPDVLFVLQDGRGIVVEIKPVFQMALHKNLIKWSALRQFCRKEGFGLLVTDGRYAIQEVQHRHINPDFVTAMRTALLRGPLSWHEYREIRDRYDVSRDEFIALILNERLIWELNPFSLSKPPISQVHTEHR